MYAQKQNYRERTVRKDFYDSGQNETSDQQEHNLDEVSKFCRQHFLNAIQVGKWIWVRFNAQPEEHVRKLLQDFGFRWSKRRGMWAHNCGFPSQSSTNGVPWHKYQCYTVSGSVNLED